MASSAGRGADLSRLNPMQTKKVARAVKGVQVCRTSQLNLCFPPITG